MLQKGTGGLIGLAALFAEQDTDGSGMLDCYEFSTAIQNLGLELNQADVQSLFRSFDRNGDS